MNTVNVLIMGAGALGSHVVNLLAKPGMKFFIVDDDVVEENNIYTSAYDRSDLGAQKTFALAQKAKMLGAEAEALHMTVKSFDDLRHLDVDVVVDCFDNYEARAHTVGLDIPTLHVGVGTEGNGICFWDKDYPFPKTYGKRGDNPVCTNGLGARILRRTSLRASEILQDWMATDQQSSDIVSERGGM